MKPTVPPRVLLSAGHHGQSPNYVDPSAAKVQAVGTQKPEAAIATTSSRRPYMLLGAGVVLLALALALLLRPSALRVRRRGMPSASIR